MTVFGLFGDPTSFDRSRHGDVRRQVRRRIAAALAPTAVLVGAALLLAIRRLAGAIVEPPSFAAAVVCAVTILAADRLSTILVHRCFGNCDVELPQRWIMPLLLAPLARWSAAVVWAIALSLGGISPAAVCVLWSPVALPAAWWAVGFFRSRPGDAPADAGDDGPDSGSNTDIGPKNGPQTGAMRGPRPILALDPTPVGPVSTGAIAVGPVEQRPVVAGHVTARMARYVTATGAEVVEGTVCVDFARGARWGAAHLAICPPLPAGPPTVDVSADDEFEAEIKVTQALPYAARFDVRLPAPAEEPLSLRLRYRIAAGGIRRPDDTSP